MLFVRFSLFSHELIFDNDISKTVHFRTTQTILYSLYSIINNISVSIFQDENRFLTIARFHRTMIEYLLKRVHYFRLLAVLIHIQKRLKTFYRFQIPFTSNSIYFFTARLQIFHGLRFIRSFPNNFSDSKLQTRGSFACKHHNIMMSDGHSRAAVNRESVWPVRFFNGLFFFSAALDKSAQK